MKTTVRSVREQIVDDLRRDIVCSRLEPGTRLSEQELAKRFGVSRGPIREALSMLVYEGLLVAKPNCGVTVSGPPPREVRELITPIRRTVESYALKTYFAEISSRDYAVWEEIILKMGLAARNNDYKEMIGLDILFHRSLVERARQPELLTIWQSLVSQIRGHFGEKIMLFQGQLDGIVEHHRRLIDEFRNGNCRSSIAALKQHIS